VADGKWIFGQALGGIDTELANVVMNEHLNGKAAPPLWATLVFGATAGSAGGYAGQGSKLSVRVMIITI
jgi:hypothetical protein